jgi:uncharacterized oligopeptide transporter (OPT) family protein
VPELVMTGHWHGFPYWQTAGICAVGGVLGVMYSIPLRRAMVVHSDLVYPEGVAAAEVLRVGSRSGRAAAGEPGLPDILLGGGVAALFSLLSGGLKLLAFGLIVGESLMGVLMAGIIGATGNQTPLVVVGAGFEGAAEWLGLSVFLLVCTGFYQRVLRQA